jgi:hypothetical protein
MIEKFTVYNKVVARARKEPVWPQENQRRRNVMERIFFGMR